MNDYLQDSEKQFLQEMIDAKIVAPDGKILDANKYIQWLRDKEAIIRTQIQEIPEPGDTYDRYNANMLYKDIDVIRQMILRQTNPSTPNREAQIIEKTERKQSEKKTFLDGIKNIFSKNESRNIPSHNRTK